MKSFAPEMNPSKLCVNFSSLPPLKEQKEKFWLKVKNPEEAAFFTILIIEEVAHKMQKNVRTIGFKRQHFILLTKIIELLQLNGKVSIE